MCAWAGGPVSSAPRSGMSTARVNATVYSRAPRAALGTENERHRGHGQSATQLDVPTEVGQVGTRTRQSLSSRLFESAWSPPASRVSAATA